MLVVEDNGAIGHFVQIEAQGTLPSLYSSVLIPPAVRWELGHAHTPEIIREWIAQPPEWIVLQAPTGSPEPRSPGAGEREAIRLTKEVGGLLLCDDQAGRSRAMREGVRATGTLGILQIAHERGWFEIEEGIERLRRRTTTFLPEARLVQIVAEARAMRERWLAR